MVAWGTIAIVGAKELGKGVLAYIGGKAFAEIAGFPDDQDIEKRLREAVEEIKACVRYETRKALEEQDIRHLAASALAIKQMLAHFDLAKTKEEQLALSALITQSIVQSYGAVALARDYRLVGSVAFMNAFSMHLAVNAANYRMNKGIPATLAAMRSEKDAAIEHLNGLLKQFGIDYRRPERFGAKNIHPINPQYDNFGNQIFPGFLTVTVATDLGEIYLYQNDDPSTISQAQVETTYQQAKARFFAQAELDIQGMTQLFSTISDTWRAAVVALENMQFTQLSSAIGDWPVMMLEKT